MEKSPSLYLRGGKRALDLAVASVGLVVLSPLFLLCAVLVRLSSSGPILFRQIRTGLNSRCFTLMKFRTMRQGAERSGTAVVVPNDARLTPVGAFLRRSKLDEIPQLINVIAGDMSLVGPRPMPLDRVEDKRLLTVRPGLTSYATVYHRNEEEYCNARMDTAAAYRELQRQKYVLDGEYLNDVSLTTDLKLILLTLLLVIMGVWSFGKSRVPSRGRTGCMLLDGAWLAGSVWLAYWLRFDGNLMDFQERQRNLCLVLLPGVQLIACQHFRIYDMVWRYINRTDVSVLVGSLTTVFTVTLLLRLMMVPQNQFPHILSLPIGVLVLDYLLAACGTVGMRCLGRSLYELERYYRPRPSTTYRRVLVFGAGQDGLEAVHSIQRLAHAEIVGFLDDDAAKRGRLIGGYRVLGGSEILHDVIRSRSVSDLVVCAHTIPSLRLERMQKICRSMGVRMHSFVPVEDILASERAIENWDVAERESLGSFASL